MADLVYLVRHAAPPADMRGRYWGRADPGVDPDDLERVPELARLIWEKPARLLASPLRRTALTAERLGAALGLTPEPASELAEADFGEFDGLTYAEIEALHPVPAAEWLAKGDRFSFPGGEAVPRFLERATRSWEHCVGLADSPVMVVTHGGVIACWCCLFLRIPFDHRFAFRAGYAALTAFVRKKDGSGWEMAVFNDRE